MAMRCIADHYEENERLPIVLEIGCADGQGTMRFAGFTQLTICVDPMVSIDGNARPDVMSPSFEDMPPDQEKITMFKRRTREFPVELVMGCSLWEETLASVDKILAGRKVDVLIVDGCHHPFEAVWADLIAYYPLVRQYGYIILDDLYEDCIQQVYDQSIENGLLEPHDRWSIKTTQILQDCAALRKTLI